jgi:hypothetical protein
MEVLRAIRDLCVHPSHAISVCIVLKKTLAQQDAHMLLHHACRDMTLTVPFMAIVVHYVATFLGLRVEPMEAKLREVPLNRRQPFAYLPGSNTTKDEHADRVRRVLEHARSIPVDQYHFSFILVEVPQELLHMLAGEDKALWCQMHGDPGHCAGLVGIAQVLRERQQVE